jgi:glucose/arabinose dehydrogenase
MALILIAVLVLLRARAAAQPAALIHLPYVTAPPPAVLEPFATGVPTPTDLTFTADGRFFTALRDGRVYVIPPEGQLANPPFLDIRDRVEVAQYWEQGLLGLAFHPDFAANGYFYVFYTAKSADPIAPAVLARFTAPADGSPVDPATELRLLTIPHEMYLHYGGQIRFGPDGYLYVAVGDGLYMPEAPSLPEIPNAQNGALLLGKILRLEVNGGDPYAIPPDNPFAGDDGIRDEIWLMGLRNPWRLSFDRATGELYVADVGEGNYEEINVVAAGQGGLNFGWPCYEGFAAGPWEDGCGPPTAYTAPIHAYDHTGGRCTIIGGYVYRGAAIPALAGRYLFADFCSGELWALRREGDETQIAGLGVFPDHRWTTFGEGLDAELYLGEFAGAATVYRLRPAP